MSKVEKITTSVILLVLITSFSIYGVWEDKAVFSAPLMILVYIAVAIWAVAAYRRNGTEGGGSRGGGSESQGKDVSLHLQTPAPPHAHTPTLPHIQTPPGGGMLLLFLLYSAVMILFSVLPYEATISTLRVGCYIGIYFAAANILSRFPRRRAVWITLFIALVFVALYSLVQHKVAPNILFGMERYTTYWEGGRLQGTYQCPNHIAHVYLMWIPLCIVFLFIPQFGWFWRICFAYAIPLFLLLIYQTQSRAALLGTVAALCALFLLLILRRSRKVFWLALVLVPLLGAGTLGGLYAGSAMFRERMQPVVRVLDQAFKGNWEQAINLDFRPQIWADSVEMIKERPWFGFGPGNYGLTYPDYRYRVKANRRIAVHPHNEPIELLAEYGAVGSVLFLGALCGIVVPLIWLLMRSKIIYHALPAAALLAALAGTAVHGFFDFELRIFPNALMLSLLAGCAVAPLLTQQKSEVRGRGSEAGNQKSATRSLTSVLRLLISITLLLTAVWAVQVMSSAWIRALASREAEAHGIERAESLYRLAARIDPQNWQAHLGLGDLFYHRRYYELDPETKRELALQERREYETANRINCKKEEAIYGLGRAELFLGNRERGLDLLRQAADYKRFNDFYWRKLGIELRKADLYEEALERFEYAQKLDRSNPTTRRNIQWLRERMGVQK